MNFFLKTLLVALLTFSISSGVKAQTFCLKLSEISNDGEHYTIKIEAQGSESYDLGSSNLQFKYPNTALSSPMLESSELSPPSYYTPTITEVSVNEISFNIELAFPETNSITIPNINSWKELGRIQFDIIDPSLGFEFEWSYNGSTTETIMYKSDESTQIFATDIECLMVEDCTPINDEAIDAFTITPDNYWGVSGWDTYIYCRATESIPSNVGDNHVHDTWYTFVAQSENTGILARANPNNASAELVDMVIEVYDADLHPLEGSISGFCSVDRSVFNNYGAGEIERAVPTNLIIGNTYYYRLYDASNAECDCNSLLDTKVKTYNNLNILSGCDTITTLDHSWIIEDPKDIYNSPPVPITHTRLVLKDHNHIVRSMTESVSTSDINPFGYKISDFSSLIPNGEYYIATQHLIKMKANGCINEFWSNTGSECHTIINIEGDVVSKLDDESCGLTDLLLRDSISAIPIYGASFYIFDFVNQAHPDNSFSITSPSHTLVLGTEADGSTIGDSQGLYYGQTYDVTIKAMINGSINNVGELCNITINSHIPSPEEIEGCGSSTLVASNILGVGIAYEFGFYKGSNNPPNSPDYMIGSDNRVLELTTSLISSLPFSENEALRIHVRVKDDFINTGSPTIQINSDWNEQSCDFVMPTSPQLASNSTFSNQLLLNIYPNPSTGEEILIKITNIVDRTQTISTKIYTLKGNLVFEDASANTGDSFNKILNFENRLARGTYFIKIEVNGNTITKKIVIE